MSNLPGSTAKKMDYIYRWQVHVYDVLRRYYLLGRNKLIASLDLSTELVCEIGCGTGRNLVAMANRYPQASFWGIEPSNVMIHYAQNKIIRSNLQNRITLIQGEAVSINSHDMLSNHTSQFDRIIFSYTLSMIQDVKKALDNALNNIRPGGYLHIIDFSDHAGFGRLTQLFHQRWLDIFSVHHNPEVYDYLQKQALISGGTCEIDYSPKHYYEIIRFQKGDDRVFF